MAVCACAGISRGKCCMRLAVRGNPSGSISRLRRSLCRRAMRRLSRRLSPEIRSWTRFYPAKTCRFSRPRPDCVCNARLTRKSRSRWHRRLYFAAQKETRQFWNGKRTQPMRLRPLKRRNFTLRWSWPPCSSASRAPHPWRRSCAAERRRKQRRGTGRSWRYPAG